MIADDVKDDHPTVASAKASEKENQAPDISTEALSHTTEYPKVFECNEGLAPESHVSDPKHRLVHGAKAPSQSDSSSIPITPDKRHPQESPVSQHDELVQPTPEIIPDSEDNKGPPPR